MATLSPSLRVPTILVAALVANVILFTLIEYMVGSKRIRLTDTQSPDISNFIRMQEESREVRSRRDPNAPQKPQSDVQRDLQRLQSANTSGADLQFDVPDFDVDLGLDLGGDIQIARELTPLVRVPPEYPTKALMDGTEGFVILRFTVTETGSVEDPEVLRADPPNLFERAARRAVLRWKYQPQIRDGKPARVISITKVNFVIGTEE
ncbi:MAG: energy transducer TonB [Pseudomonadota bacterium]